MPARNGIADRPAPCFKRYAWPDHDERGRIAPAELRGFCARRGVETQPTSRPESVGTASGLDGERAPVATVAIACPRCGTEVAPALLACPACGWLRFSSELKRLATSADEHAAAGRATGALAAWRSARELLPRNSQHYATIACPACGWLRFSSELK